MLFRLDRRPDDELTNDASQSDFVRISGNHECAQIDYPDHLH